MNLRLPGFGPSLPPTPQPVDREAIAEEAKAERARELRLRRGRRSTILTGSEGVGELGEGQTRRPTLLGE